MTEMNLGLEVCPDVLWIFVIHSPGQEKSPRPIVETTPTVFLLFLCLSLMSLCRTLGVLRNHILIVIGIYHMPSSVLDIEGVIVSNRYIIIELNKGHV